ncbi:MAG: hypothetical protein PF447_00655 [Spirochaetaceae bacterium]|jgi:hypothetical protein|nr:hypothetical protein [Spirochaetaceae bacterium]
MSILVIPKKRLWISLFIILLSTVSILFIGINQQQGDELNLKIDVENLLFWGIITFLIQLWVGLSLLIKNKSIKGDLEKISHFDDITHPKVKKIFKGLGELGLGIEKILEEQNNLVVLRTNRIIALNSLIQMLCEDNKLSILITDITGAAVGISDSLYEKLQKETKENSWMNFAEIRPDINFSEVMTHLEKLKTPWSSDAYPGVLCTPVLDKLGTLHFCIWNLEKDQLTKHFKERRAENKPKKGKKGWTKMMELLPNKKKERNSTE